MGFGSATKKIQKVADMAEELYKRLNELREQLQQVRETVQSTHDRVEDLERELEEQRALVEALASEQGIDVDRVLADAAIEDVDASEESPESDSGGETA